MLDFLPPSLYQEFMTAIKSVLRAPPPDHTRTYYFLILRWIRISLCTPVNAACHSLTLEEYFIWVLQARHLKMTHSLGIHFHRCCCSQQWFIILNLVLEQLGWNSRHHLECAEKTGRSLRGTSSVPTTGWCFITKQCLVLAYGREKP